MGGFPGPPPQAAGGKGQKPAICAKPQQSRNTIVPFSQFFRGHVRKAEACFPFHSASRSANGTKRKLENFGTGPMAGKERRQPAQLIPRNGRARGFFKCEPMQGNARKAAP